MTDRSRIHAFFDPATHTMSYVVWDPATRCAAVIDPVLDVDARTGRIVTASAERILACVAEQRLAVHWILETHAHADHLSSAQYLRARCGGRVAIGAGIRVVQAAFAEVCGLDARFMADLSPFDHLLRDGETLPLGELEVTALHVPGHTPADMAYLVDGSVFVGDTLFMPDVGSARCDFPGGCARQLYRSIRRLLELPPETAMYVCHDYPPPHRGPAWQTTVGAQRAANVHVHAGVPEGDFVAMRVGRDATLGAPALLSAAMQVNLRAGRLPGSVDPQGVERRI